MRTLLSLTLPLVVGAFALASMACEDSDLVFDPSDPGGLSPAGPPGACTPWPECKDGDGGDGGGGGSTDPIPLGVVLPAGFDVASDDGGAYVDGTEDVAAQIFGSDNFGLDVAAKTKGGGRNRTDRRICLTIRSLADGTVLSDEGCLDLNITTSQPDDPPGGFRLMAPGGKMTTRMRFLWAGSDGTDRWIRYGSKCELVDNNWVDDLDTRAVVTAGADGDGDGSPDDWTIESSDAGAFWCRGNPDNVEPHPGSDDPEGRVLATVRFEATGL